MSIAWYLLLRLCAPNYCKAPIHTLWYTKHASSVTSLLHSTLP